MGSNSKKVIMSLRKELPLMGIVLLPVCYLAYVWNDLPNKVPLHWNMNGEVDNYGDKSQLVFISILLPLFVYGIFLIIPKIDPKNKLNNMGNKLNAIKILLTTFISAIVIFIIYAASHASYNINFIVLLIGILYIVCGNYFKTIKANYFIGIRTPWTLESDEVWKSTHRLGGIMWFIGGFAIVISSSILSIQTNFKLLTIITIIIVLTPIIYSYYKFRSIQKQASSS